MLKAHLAECRVRHLSTMVSMVKKLPEADRAIIEPQLPRDALQAIAGASALAWVDVRHNVEMTEVIATHLGVPRTRAFYRAFLNVAYDSPLMRNFIQSTIRIIQQEVALGLRLLPRGYELIFRNVGRWHRSDIQKTEARLSLHDLPAVCVNSRLWLESVAGGLESLFDLGGRDGTVDITKVDTELGNVDFHLRWS